MATTQPAYNSAENSVATAPSTDRFTDRLWAETKALRESIDSLEFLRRLGDGTLPLDAFRTYIEQDKLYLEGYSKALSLVAAHAPPDPQSAGFWSNSASTAATVESALHDGLLTGGILPAGSGRLEHSQACLGYVSYLTATAATAPYPVSAAAVLPLLLDLRRGRPRSCRFSARGTRRRSVASVRTVGHDLRRTRIPRVGGAGPRAGRCCGRSCHRDRA